ncbi:winged helix-turn-helix transcriptional regulator [Leisingera aquaemixtae]|uniref:winged helix-turn-helix transcriptional regulator n=1 Tax=Leisingera aquaemixtae TaxID=1396826 RepID=UPI0021A2DCE3|nr:helix-turn-helix domain-containing protein [Leisingera aquaemixtae]
MSNSASDSRQTPPAVRRRALVPKEQCPMALAAEILGDRWTLLILREAFYGVCRYDDMREDLKAPRSTLTVRLNSLVARGILEKQPYQEAGDRVRQAYVLTQAGQGLALTFLALAQWGEAHVTGGAAPVGVVDRETGAPLRVALVDAEGAPADPARAALRLRR